MLAELHDLYMIYQKLYRDKWKSPCLPRCAAGQIPLLRAPSLPTLDGSSVASI
jgi:hypothetical protein